MLTWVAEIQGENLGVSGRGSAQQVAEGGVCFQVCGRSSVTSRFVKGRGRRFVKVVGVVLRLPVGVADNSRTQRDVVE